MEPMPEYRCPGQPYPISRAVHLGRLARFYPGCRHCPQREDTGTLSEKHVRRLKETRPRRRPRLQFHQEWAGGMYPNDLGPPQACRLAAAFGLLLQRHPGFADTPHRPAAGVQAGRRPPLVVVASDGRPISCELLAAVAEGLRFSGCNLVDIGSATAACVAVAIHHLRAAGGVLAGNPAERRHMAGLKLWAPGPRPLSAGPAFDALEPAYRAGVDRPTRSYGSRRRFQAEPFYLAALTPHYHALRPLRCLLATGCDPVFGYLHKLTEQVACRIIPCRIPPQGLSAQVAAAGAHLAVSIGDDGETCRVWDEQGRCVSGERLLLLVARHPLREQEPARAVLENAASPAAVEAVRATGAVVLRSDARRAAMERAMRQHEAQIGGGPSGRFWYAAGGFPLPDALATLTRLLVVLSRTDRPFSQVLDREAALR